MPDALEDPDAVDVVPAQPRRRRTGAIAIAVVALVAVGGGATWLATRDGGAGAAGDGVCPATAPVSPPAPGSTPTVAVPADPTASGVDGRLVPAADPTGVVLCEYPQPYRPVTVPLPEFSPGIDVPSGSEAPGGVEPEDPAPAVGAGLPLGRTAGHDGSDPAVAALLTALQSAPVRAGSGYTSCLVDDDGSVPPQYLVRLTYPDGTVWVAGPDVCQGSTNGVTGSDLDISAPVLAALDAPNGPPTLAPVTVATPDEPVGARTSPVVTPTSPAGGVVDDPCTAVGLPMPGGPDAFVPFTPTAVLVCHAGPGTAEGWDSMTSRSTAVAVPLRHALTAVPAAPADPAVVTCTGPPGDRWSLLFTGADGAAELVLVDGKPCRTATNGWRTAQIDDAFLALLDAVD